MNRLQHLKNPQIKGYKKNMVIDKRHSNNDLPIQMWRLSTKNGLETEKNDNDLFSVLSQL